MQLHEFNDFQFLKSLEDLLRFCIKVQQKYYLFAIDIDEMFGNQSFHWIVTFKRDESKTYETNAC